MSRLANSFPSSIAPSLYTSETPLFEPQKTANLFIIILSLLKCLCPLYRFIRLKKEKNTSNKQSVSFQITFLYSYTYLSIVVQNLIFIENIIVYHSLSPKKPLTLWPFSWGQIHNKITDN